MFRGPPAGEESFSARRGFLREPPPGQAFCPKTLGKSRIVPGRGLRPLKKPFSAHLSRPRRDAIAWSASWPASFANALRPFPPGKPKKKSLTERTASVKDEYTLSAVPPCVHGLPRALSGPFDDLFPARLSAPQALCAGIIAVTPASTVWDYEILFIILPRPPPVNPRRQFFSGLSPADFGRSGGLWTGQGWRDGEFPGGS